ncbi:hypothetical protein [Proteus sp. NMG38-2]|uniref:hypothetical protein n=1 Tax=Proteus sp. NMG38-2 TaxID=2883107 RepID=UPI001D0BD6D6|nr:hypothetical protein [Proteus sp. NMG38-2]UDN34864.1 hypothetical protein LG402_14065 [Proteus sp. NMG38-2]
MTKNKTVVETEQDINSSANSESEVESPICGIIMPIANTDGYPAGHWDDVYSIVCKAATLANFKPNLVSFDGDIGVIQKRIIQNIYSNPIVICDISSRNANVMFELGMRLAFDKPTIIIKDNKTPYSFDISPIEHLEYPADLRYQSINDFQEKLKNKIVETLKKAEDNPHFTTFLKHFGTFKVAKLDEKEVSSTEFLASEIKELRSLILSDIKGKSHLNQSLSSKNSVQIPPMGYEYSFKKPNEHATLDKVCNLLNKNGYSVSLATQGDADDEILLVFPKKLEPIQRFRLQGIINNFFDTN